MCLLRTSGFALMSFQPAAEELRARRPDKAEEGTDSLLSPSPLPQPSDDDTVSLHSQVSETARADALSLLSKMDHCKGYRK